VDVAWVEELVGRTPHLPLNLAAGSGFGGVRATDVNDANWLAGAVIGARALRIVVDEGGVGHRLLAGCHDDLRIADSPWRGMKAQRIGAARSLAAGAQPAREEEADADGRCPFFEESQLAADLGKGDVEKVVGKQQWIDAGAEENASLL
jgi:hypothetical protein